MTERQLPFIPRSPAQPRDAAPRQPWPQHKSNPGARQTQMQIADELLKFSLYKGVDPDLVGVTTWAQPWVPMWLEWEVKVEALDPPTLEAWRLGSVDLESR